MAAAREVEAAILANGDFPAKGGMGRDILSHARHVVCCDGAADSFFEAFGREPDAVVGDGDSLKGRFANVVLDPGQDDNDLDKAVRYCREAGWAKPVVLGATGKREDHTLGNIFRALGHGLEIVTDCGRFVPVEGRARFSVGEGSAISIFAPDPETRMESKGLEWPLDGVKFSNLYCATLNRSAAPEIELFASRRVYAYFAET